MAGWGEHVELAMVGTFYLVLSVGAVDFALRAIRLIEAEGRADRRTMWRLAALRTLAAALALSGGLCVFFLFATVLGSALGMSLVLLGDPGLSASMIAIPLLLFLGAFGSLVAIIGDEGPAAFRSFAALRWLSERLAAAWSSAGHWPPIAAVRRFVRKLDRPLW